MSYICQEQYCTRIPTFPLQYAQKYLETLDINKSLKKEKDINAFKTAVMIANGELYSDLKEMNNNQILGKYLLRMASRPTPFGGFAQISTSKFKKDNYNDEMLTHSNLDEIKSLYKVSNLWLNNVIHRLELECITELELICNQNIYAMNGRLYNPIMVRGGCLDIDSKNNPIESVDIREIAVVKDIQKKAKEFINYTDLYNYLKEKHVNLTENIFFDIIKKLLEEEFIYSNLRIPAYCQNKLEYVLKQLKETDMYYSYTYKELEDINDILKTIGIDTDFQTIHELYNKMERIYKCRDYIQVDTSRKIDFSINYNWKNKLEHFVNELTKIPIEVKEYDSIDIIKEKFNDTFGTNQLVPLKYVIDQHIFDGLSLLETQKTELSNKEKQIRKIYTRSIEKAIMNQQSIVDLKSEDFKEYWSNKHDYPQSFDLNIIVNGNNMFVGPNIGASLAGNSTERFYPLYKIDKKNIEPSNYLECYCFEVQQYGKANNIMSWYKKDAPCIVVGTHSSETDIISINDICLYLNEDNKLLIVHEKTKKIIKLLPDSMLVRKSNNKIIQLLKLISNHYDEKVLERLDVFLQGDRIYCPEIRYEDVVVSPEYWMLDKMTIELDNFDSFQKSFECFRAMYNLPQYVYLCELDNRLIIDTKKTYFSKLIFKQIKKREFAKLTALEFDFKDNLVVRDELRLPYFSEFVFSFISEDINESEFKKIRSLELYKPKDMKKCFDDGWIYFNLYKYGNNSTPLLNKIFNYCNKKKNLFEWFYINYYDDKGKHIRFRAKVYSEDNYIQVLGELTKLFNECVNENLIGFWNLTPYRPEISRYGGREILPKIEKIFCQDSYNIIKNQEYQNSANIIDLVENLINYISGFIDNPKTLFLIFDKYYHSKEYRKEYHRSSKEIKLRIKKILDNTDKVNEDNLKKQVINSIEELDVDYMESIFLSIIHMHCNRIFCDRNIEKQAHIYIRNALRDLQVRG